MLEFNFPKEIKLRRHEMDSTASFGTERVAEIPTNFSN